MLTAENRHELEHRGYTRVPGVISSEEANKCIAEYRAWLSEFGDGGWPHTLYSLIQRYNVGHMEPTWRARLAAKQVFAQLWNTDKLLTSFDAISIGRPPESSEEHFSIPGNHWLHCDQSAVRRGLHAYQGALYLEDAEADDWTFQVLEGSHRLHNTFYDSNHKAKIRSITNEYYRLRTADVEWYSNRGIKEATRVPCSKGGMVLWDSRLVHANARPIKGRNNPDRFRYVVFVCMTPAKWAIRADLKVKKEAYGNVRMTTHWPSQGIGLFPVDIPSYARKDVTVPTKLPPMACTDQVKRLCGIIPYNFNDGRPNGPNWAPEWTRQRELDTVYFQLWHYLMVGAVLITIASGLFFFLTSEH